MPIDKVIECCMGGASITDRGNLKLGELTIQRKGGDGRKPTAPVATVQVLTQGTF